MWQSARCRLGHLVIIHARCNHQKPLVTARYVRLFSSNRDGRPLRILFCGSDDFSITSLRALHDFSKSSDGNILSIDVATKTDKRTGRGLKVIKPPPIQPVAKELGLPIHQFDTFTGWMLPHYGPEESGSINLVVAVSFGLLVPPRVLKACQYGGLNVHPSMLPDLKGSSPIEHAILHGYTQTGVTVQTLHPSKFDAGLILEQTPSPGIAIPDPEFITSRELKDLLAPIGAELLVKAIRNHRYLPGSEPLTPPMPKHDRLAPKLHPDSRRIDFLTADVEHILRMNRAIPKLWAEVSDSASGTSKTRVLFGTSMRRAQQQDFHGRRNSVRPGMVHGTGFAVISNSDNILDTKAPLLVAAKYGSIAIPEMTVSGSPEGPAAKCAAKAGLFGDPIDVEGFKLYKFREPFNTGQTPIKKP